MNAPARYHYDDVGELTATDIPRIMGEAQRRANDDNPPADLSGLAAPTAKPITIPEDDSRSHIALAWALIIAGCIGSAIALGTISWLALTSTGLWTLLSQWLRVVS